MISKRWIASGGTSTGTNFSCIAGSRRSVYTSANVSSTFVSITSSLSAGSQARLSCSIISLLLTPETSRSRFLLKLTESAVTVSFSSAWLYFVSLRSSHFCSSALPEFNDAILLKEASEGNKLPRPYCFYLESKKQ